MNLVKKQTALSCQKNRTVSCDLLNMQRCSMQVVTQVAQTEHAAQTGNAIVDVKKNVTPFCALQSCTEDKKRGLTSILHFSFMEIMTLCQSEVWVFFVNEIDIFCVQVCVVSTCELTFLCASEWHQHKHPWKQSKPGDTSTTVHGTDKLQHLKAGSLHSHHHGCVDCAQQTNL
jgi:hypothetical protein